MTNVAPSDPNDPLTYYWKREVSDLAAVQNSAITPEYGFRHYAFSLLALALLADAFNGNKEGQWGDYPFRDAQQLNPDLYDGGRYLGHNIACFAVDGRGEIIDFEFNHNNLFNSSAEHAEARLVRRIFSLNQIFDHWQTIRSPRQLIGLPSTTTLDAVTIYTTLESCAQCSGIMTLANLSSVVYLQSDPGQYRIGNILFNLSNPLTVSHPTTSATPRQKYGAPEPISADLFRFPYKAALEAGYQQFIIDMSRSGAYFWQSSNGTQQDNSISITSFLCSDVALNIFKAAAIDLDGLSVQHGSFRPTVDSQSPPALTNAEILDQARRFRIYVRESGHRGTPHK
jgi:tRNA(Arg) A34 adenosine deaminase TadA